MYEIIFYILILVMTIFSENNHKSIWFSFIIIYKRHLQKEYSINQTKCWRTNFFVKLYWSIYRCLRWGWENRAIFREIFRISSRTMFPPLVSKGVSRRKQPRFKFRTPKTYPKVSLHSHTHSQLITFAKNDQLH